MKTKFFSLLVLFLFAAAPLFAQKASDFKIAIMPGHGPDTPGKRSCPFNREVTHEFRGQKITVKPGEQFREYYANTGISYYQAEILEGMGFQIKRMEFNNREGTGPCEIHELDERKRIMREWGANISIENHFNAFGDGRTFNSAKGICTYTHNIHPADSMALAKHVQGFLVQVANQYNRGTPTAQFIMCDTRTTGCKASILIEHAFMTNEQEATELFCNPEIWYKYAEATAKGVCAYTGVPYKEPKLGRSRSAKKEKTAEEKPAKKTTKKAKKKATLKKSPGELEVSVNNVEIRKGPRQSSAVVGVAARGKKYTVVAATKDGKWYKLDDGNYITTDKTSVRFKSLRGK